MSVTVTNEYGTITLSKDEIFFGETIHISASSELTECSNIIVYIYNINTIIGTTTSRSLDLDFTPSLQTSGYIHARFNNNNKKLGEIKIYLTIKKPLLVNETVNVINGSATHTVNTQINPGIYEINGEYPQNNNYQSGTDTGTLTVTQAPTLATVLTSENTIELENSVIITATLTSNNNPITEGTFTLYEDDTPVVFNQTLNSNGQCTLRYVPTTIGEHNYYIKYNGTTIYEPVTSTTYTVTVTRINVTITSLCPTKVELGDTQVELKAKVTTTNGNQPVDRGNFNFKITGSSHVVSTVNNGVFAYIWDSSILKAGTYQIQLVYGLNTKYNSARPDPILIEIVNPPEPFTDLTLTEQVLNQEEGSLDIICAVEGLNGEYSGMFPISDGTDYLNNMFNGEIIALLSNSEGDKVAYIHEVGEGGAEHLDGIMPYLENNEYYFTNFYYEEEIHSVLDYTFTGNLGLMSLLFVEDISTMENAEVIIMLTPKDNSHFIYRESEGVSIWLSGG